MSTDEPLDLDAIRGRYETAESIRPGGFVMSMAFQLSARDVPALIAEVEALRAAVADAQRLGRAKVLAHLGDYLRTYGGTDA